MKYTDIEHIFNALITRYSNNIDTELKYLNHFQLLVAIMLSAQSTDKQVNNITKSLFSWLKSPHEAYKAGIEKINNEIKSINYHNSKAKHIWQASKTIIEVFNGKIPNSFEGLIKLSGVGRKTANLFLSIALKQNKIAVDTHVFRVSNRLGLVKADTPTKTEIQLAKNIPEKYHRQINNLLIPFGREFCKAINPKCNICPFPKKCKKYNKDKNTKTCNTD